MRGLKNAAAKKNQASRETVQHAATYASTVPRDAPRALSGTNANFYDL
jgi:hypothetical protein